MSLVNIVKLINNNMRVSPLNNSNLITRRFKVTYKSGALKPMPEVYLQTRITEICTN